MKNTNNTNNFKPSPSGGAGGGFLPRGLRNNNSLNIRNITQIIMRWAPPNENNTSAYVAKVSQMSGIHPTEPLDFNDRGQMIAIVRAMAYVENGVIIEGDSIREGYQLAINN